MAIASYKGLFLASEFPSRFSETFRESLRNDLGYIALILLAVLLSPRRRFFAAGVLIVLITSNAWYFADTMAIVIFNERFSYRYLIEFLPTLPLSLSIFTWYHWALLASFLSAHLISMERSRLTTGSSVILFVTAVAMAGNPERSVANHIRPYAYHPKSMDSLEHMDVATDDSKFTELEMTRGRKDFEENFSIHIPETKPDIILLIVESLSSYDLSAFGGERTWLPRLERLMHAGTAFTNFRANYSISLGGQISLLNGLAPIPFPTMEDDEEFLQLGNFGHQPSVVRELGRLGYHNEYISPVPLRFMNFGRYASTAGFHTILGKLEVPEFAAVRGFHLHKPEDRILYDVALTRIDRMDRRNPFFMTLVTLSSHYSMALRAGSFMDPRTGSLSESMMWDYVDEQIERFVEGLEDRSFFDRGILIITGDHVKHGAGRSEGELRAFGASARMRVPLLLIGHGIERGRIDRRLFSQTDLLANLDRLSDPSATLSPFVVWTERFNRHSPKKIGLLRIFTAEDAGDKEHRAWVSGTRFGWIDDPPPNAAHIERRIQSQRAAGQYYFRARNKMNP